MKQVWNTEKDVLQLAWAVFLRTLEVEAALIDKSGDDEGTTLVVGRYDLYEYVVMVKALQFSA